MKTIQEKLHNLSSIVNNLSKTKNINDDESKLYNGILDVIKELDDKVEKVLINQAVLAENVKYMDEDISGIQGELFEEVSVEDLEEMEQSEYQEIKCPKCGKPIFVEESVLSEENNIQCPYCNEKLNK